MMRIAVNAAMIVILACIFIFSLLPADDIAKLCPRGLNPAGVFRLYPVLHFIAYMGLALCLFFLINRRSASRYPAALLVPLILGGVIEVLQGALHIPSHSASIVDLSINIFGISTAAGVTWVCERE
jgi:VanZ family protein